MVLLMLLLLLQEVGRQVGERRLLLLLLLLGLRVRARVGVGVGVGLMEGKSRDGKRFREGKTAVWGRKECV